MIELLLTIIIIPITELLGPNAQMHAHSGGTVKFARAHWDSPYFPNIPPLGNLQNIYILASIQVTNANF